MISNHALTTLSSFYHSSYYHFSYVDRLADSLHQKLKTANNLLRQARVVVERKESAKQLQIATEPKLKKVVEKTKELKKDVNMSISFDYASFAFFSKIEIQFVLLNS